MFAISTKSGSTFRIPSITLVHIKGNMVKKAIKTGTISTLNHIKASKISDITGVDRIVTKIGFKKALKELLTPAKIPNPIPKINEMAKPINPLIMVSPTMDMKFSEIKSFKVATRVDSGGGKISSEP